MKCDLHRFTWNLVCKLIRCMQHKINLGNSYNWSCYFISNRVNTFCIFYSFLKYEILILIYMYVIVVLLYECTPIYLVKRHNLITKTWGYYQRILTASTEPHNLLGVNEVSCGFLWLKSLLLQTSGAVTVLFHRKRPKIVSVFCQVYRTLYYALKSEQCSNYNTLRTERWLWEAVPAKTPVPEFKSYRENEHAWFKKETNLF